MVRLSHGLAAALIGLSSLTGAIAQSTDTDIPDVDGPVAVGFPSLNLTATIAKAEGELGLNGTVTDNITPEDAAPPTTRLLKRLSYDLRKRANPIPAAVLGNIACVALKIVFPTKVGLAGDAFYVNNNNPSFWSTISYNTPVCVFQPTSSLDISLAVRLFTLVQNDFSLVGGGHNAIPGWTNNGDGVLIVMSGMKGVTIGQGFAGVAAGNRWGETYTALDAKKLSVVGGRVSTVGVPGLTLGGGISYLTNSKGFACDNVKNYEIVLADGRVVNANSNENPDLFRALKGGAFNFGIVTRFDLYTYPAPAVYSGALTFTQDQFPTLFGLDYDYATKGAYVDVQTHVISAYVWLQAYGMYLGAFLMFRNTTVAQPGPALQPFFNLPNAGNTCALGNYSTPALSLGAGDATGFRQEFRTFSVLPNAQLFQDLFNFFDQSITPIKQTSGLMGNIVYHPITSNAIQFGIKNGGNSLGLENTKELIVVGFNFQWNDASMDSTVMTTFDNMVAKMIQMAKSRSLFHPYIYMNYAGKLEDPISAYGAASVARLQAAKSKYDPNNVFGTQVPGGFKVPN